MESVGFPGSTSKALTGSRAGYQEFFGKVVYGSAMKQARQANSRFSQLEFLGLLENNSNVGLTPMGIKLMLAYKNAIADWNIAADNFVSNYKGPPQSFRQAWNQWQNDNPLEGKYMPAHKDIAGMYHTAEDQARMQEQQARTQAAPTSKSPFSGNTLGSYLPGG
jgi:hypothetical protein